VQVEIDLKEVNMHPIRKKAQPVCIMMAVLMLLLSIPHRSAMSALVETETMLNMSRGQQARDYLRQTLARENVRSVLIAKGVDPLEAQARIDSLTDAEVVQLADQIEQLPAGGNIFSFVIGVLLIVILILVIIKLI
jgi:hypothetical protein